MKRLFFFLLLMASAGAQSATSKLQVEKVRSGMLVSTAWLTEHLQDKDLQDEQE